MSFLKNIMSPFLEFKEEETPPGSKEAKVRTDEIKTVKEKAPVAPEEMAVTLPGNASAPKSGVRADYQKYFEDLIEDANTKNALFQGTDFKEFIDSKIDVEAIADEATRYKTAFNVLKRTGLTKEKLVSTGHQYINIIDSDLKGFSDAYSQQYNKEVEQNELLLQKKAGELQELNERITTLSQEVKKVSQEITHNKELLNLNKEAFIRAGENKKKEIEAELQKIDQYF
jgi:hypothetical protein